MIELLAGLEPFALEPLGMPATCYLTAYNSSGQYTVMYLDYPNAPAATDHAAMKEFLDDLRDGQRDLQEQMGGKFTVVRETDITLNGNPGRFMVAGLNDSAIFRVKMVVVKKRVYCITVSMPRDDPKAADPKVYEKLSMKFLDSFNLTKDPLTHDED